MRTISSDRNIVLLAEGNKWESCIPPAFPFEEAARTPSVVEGVVTPETERMLLISLYSAAAVPKEGGARSTLNAELLWMFHDFHLVSSRTSMRDTDVPVGALSPASQGM